MPERATGSHGGESHAWRDSANEEGETGPDNQMPRGLVGAEPLLWMAEQGESCEVPEVPAINKKSYAVQVDADKSY